MRKPVLFAISGAILLAMLSSSIPQAEAAFLDGWEFRVQIDISGEYIGGYQFRMDLDAQDNLGNHISFADFRDLRFTSDDQVTLLDYWIENYNDNDNVVVWVELASDNSQTEIYAYYGNSGAASVDNGNNTFLLFEDFEIWENDNLKWVELDDANNTITHNPTTEVLDITAGAVLYNDGFYSVENFARPFIFEIGVTPGTADFNFMGLKDTGDEAFPAEWNASFVHSLNWRSGFNTLYNGGSDAGLQYALDLTQRWAYAALPGAGTVIDNNLETDRTWADNFTDAATSTSPLKVGFVNWNQAMTIDNIRVRKFSPSEPTYNAGIEARDTIITLAEPTATNTLIDRDSDSVLTTPLLSTVISVQITQETEGENASTFDDNFISLFVQDNNSVLVIDNAAPVSSIIDNENAKTYIFAAYNPLDNMLDTALGGFLVSISALDNFGTQDNHGFSVVFTVSDLTDNVSTQENISGHQHRISGDAGRPDFGSITLTQAWVIDNNDGTIVAAISGTAYENTYFPTDNGTVHAVFETAELDGTNDNDALNYFYPNLAPGVVSVTVDNTLIDNHRSDNAITATLITVIFEDNDNFDDFLDNFLIILEGGDDVVVENVDVFASATFENENRAIVTLTYDAEDNALTQVALGDWDVLTHAEDNWSTIDTETTDVFTVDEIFIPIFINPDNTEVGFAVGFRVLVTGTITRGSGDAASIDDGTLVDSAEGTIDIGSGNSIDENYPIDLSSPGDTVTITITSYDGVLDGENENTYDVNENRFYPWNILAEDNHRNAYNLVASRTYTMVWYFENGEGVEENVVANVGSSILQNDIRLVTLSDNGLYLRSLIPENFAENLVFYLVEDNTNRDLVNQYTYTLEDFTGTFLPEDNGQLWTERLIDNTLVTLNADYWDGDLTSPVWLINNIKHRYTVKNSDGNERTVAFFIADDDFDRTIIVRPLTPENIIFINSNVTWAVWRENNSIFIQYDDQLDNTDNSTINIYVFGDSTVQFTNTTTSSSYTVEWTEAENLRAYEIELIVNHGHPSVPSYSERRMVDQNLQAFVIIDVPDDADLGNPVPLLSLASIVIITIVALNVTPKYTVQITFVIVFMTAFLKLIGFLNIDWIFVGLALTIAILYALGEGRRT